MQYYNNDIAQKFPKLLDYFRHGIIDEDKNISHCLLFWGPDITSQCELALEISRLLNCSEDKSDDCSCLNCKWIREQAHPAVKICTRFGMGTDNPESGDDEETKGSKISISKEQVKGIISELLITSDYHRVYIFCDRDEEGHLLPLTKAVFPDVTSNALLKTFEEPPMNTTFIFLTRDKSDVISTVASRAQSFFVPSLVEDNLDYSLVESVISNYWTTNRNSVLEFENKLSELMENNDSIEVLVQIQNYMLATIKSNLSNKHLYYKLVEDMGYVEDAKRQLSLSPSMAINSVLDNLCFKLIL